MEHREGDRKPLDVDVVIGRVHDNAANTLTGRICNISLSGLYLEMPDVQVPTYTRLRLRFRVRVGDTYRVFVWHGLVVRVSDNGVGVMFENADPLETDGLLELLHALSTDRNAARH